MRINYRIAWPYLLLVFPIWRVMMPWLGYRTRARSAFIVVLIWAAIMCVRNIRMTRKVFQLKSILVVSALALLCFIYLPSIYSLFGAGQGLVAGDLVMGLLYGSFMLIPYFSLTRGRIGELKFLTLVLVAGIVLTAFFTKSANSAMTDPDMELSRVLTSVNQSVENEALDAKIQGVGGYDYMYICALFLPLFGVFVFLAKGWILRVLAGLGAYACAVNLFLGGLGTPVFVALIETSLVLIGYTVRWFKRRVLVLGIVISFCLFLFALNPGMFSFLSPPFRLISEALPAGSIQYRFETVADALSGDKRTYAYNRYRLQVDSWEVFLANPILGVAGKSREGESVYLGGHSLLLDRMGLYGIPGLITYLFYFICIIRYMRALQDFLPQNKDLRILSDACMGAFLFASIANPFHAFFPVCFFIPGMALLFRRLRYAPMPPPYFNPYGGF